MLSRVIHFFRTNIVLTVILGGFLLLSSTGLFYNFGLATTVNDETPPFVAALKMIADHTLRPAYPTFYYLPVVAYAQLPFAALAVLSLPLLGVATSVDAMREFVILDFAKLLPWARLASMCYGTLALIVFYHMARMLFKERRTALLAVFFFATSYLFVELAHFGRVWTVQMLAVVLSLWAILQLLHEPTLRRYLAAAAGVAISFGINMVGALVYVPFAVAHFVRMKGRSISVMIFERNFFIAHMLILFLVILFYYLNPYGFENYITYIKRFFASLTGSGTSVASVVLGEHSNLCGEGSFFPWVYYLRVLVFHESFLVLLSLLGVFMLWYHRRGEKRGEVIILGAFLVAYTIGITILSALEIANCEQRYILPVIPVMALLGAFGVAKLIERMVGYRSVLLLLCLVLPLYGPVMFDARLALPSTRLEARAWMLNNIPSDAKIISIEERLDLPENLATLEYLRTTIPGRMTAKRTFLVAHPERIGTPAYFMYNPAFGVYASREGFDYLIISWWRSGDRKAQLEHLQSLGFPGEPVLLSRFPADATDDSESVDLANNNATLSDLWSLRQNGPIVDVYELR